MNGTLVDGKYQVVRQLGQGGMGAVYEAQHIGTGRKVALKVIVPEALQGGGGSDIIARFQREARASGAIDSQHVVQVLDTGVDATTESPYLVMEHLTGEDVRGLLDRVGTLPPAVALRIIAQACVGLSKAHAMGIIHRDIKAANLFLTQREGGELVVKILDFGIAKVRSSALDMSQASMTKTGTMLGSPVYMSPEQVVGNKDLDARADIFSLGITLYEALTGTTPNAEAETMGALLIAICAGRGEPLTKRVPETPPAVVAIFQKATALEAAMRYGSADEMRAAILPLLPQGVQLHESMLPTFHTPPTSSGRLPVLAATDARAAAAFLPQTTTERKTRAAWKTFGPLSVFLAAIGAALGIFALALRAPPKHAPVAALVIDAGATVTKSVEPTVSPPLPSDDPVPSVSASASASASRPEPAKRPGNPKPATTAKPNCNPNYYFDKDGVRHFKEECF